MMQLALLDTVKEIAEGCRSRLRKGPDSGDLQVLRLCDEAINKATPRRMTVDEISFAQEALEDFIEVESANGAADGFACSVARELLSEAKQWGDNCFMSLSGVHLAILNHCLEQAHEKQRLRHSSHERGA